MACRISCRINPGIFTSKRTRPTVGRLQGSPDHRQFQVRTLLQTPRNIDYLNYLLVKLRLFLSSQKLVFRTVLKKDNQQSCPDIQCIVAMSYRTLLESTESTFHLFNATKCFDVVPFNASIEYNSICLKVDMLGMPSNTFIGMGTISRIVHLCTTTQTYCSNVTSFYFTCSMALMFFALKNVIQL